MILSQAANILVDDDTCCVISDFGQSEMRSEVYRITHASPPRTVVFPSNHLPPALDSILTLLLFRWDVTLAGA